MERPPQTLSKLPGVAVHTGHISASPMMGNELDFEKVSEQLNN